MSSKKTLILSVAGVIFAIIFIMLTLLRMRPASAIQPTSEQYWPTEGWRTSPPEVQGMNGSWLKELSNYVQRDLPHIQSVLIIRRGHIVFEEYYRGYNSKILMETASITKSVTSALVGIALNKGYLKNVDQKVIEFFPEYADTLSNPQIKEISLKHLLTMTSGVNWSEEISWSWPNQNDNWMNYIINTPLANLPGETFTYYTPGVHLLSGILSKSTGMMTGDFAQTYLFKPLGISTLEWSNDPQGIPNGGRGLFLTPRDMAKFGYLYLNNGIWDNRLVIPSEWIKASTHSYVSGGFPENTDYGYLWWTTKEDNYPAFFAAGYGGQYIEVIPALDLVVVITSDNDTAHPENRDIIRKYIVPAVYDD